MLNLPSPIIEQASRQRDHDRKSAEEYFPGNGIMHRAIHDKDWNQTLLGPISTWPDSIRTAISISLDSSFQLVVLCGPELVYVYNDAAIPIFGDKHPWALGERAADVWSEAWTTIGPMLNSVLMTGQATRYDDLLFVINRHGFMEECYFTFSYSPVRIEDNKIGGVFVAVLETSERVINERRLHTLSDLASQIILGGGGNTTFDLVKQALSRNLYDVPFAALYLTDAKGDMANLAFCTCEPGKTSFFARPISLRTTNEADIEQPIVRAVQTNEPQLFDAKKILREIERCGAWPEQPRSALALPFMLPGQTVPRGVFVVGVNPRKSLDDKYRTFFSLLVGHVATAVANVEATEMERRRAAAMVELDRSKSQFFSNASHELRTPVTLILGPLEEILTQENEGLSSATKERLEMARRNARRLHKLVNSIMDFASIEAGQLLVRLEPTDIGNRTVEIASLFRSTIELSGLVFTVQTPMSKIDALIDREMWEKVVLNLLSNAFKFTLAGQIDVVLRSDHDFFYLIVRDTGCGIAPDDLPHIFERFFRVRSATGRSAEGSGIGLALVHELVRLHGGCIRVESTLQKGTTFIVQLPLHGSSATNRPVTADPGQWPADSSGKLRQAFVDEAGRHARRDGGLADASVEALVDDRHEDDSFLVATPTTTLDCMKVVVVDDNDDMVRYIERLLEGICTVISAHDGVSGLKAIRRHNPELILMDVMMPQLDGYGLLKAIREDRRLHTISVIILSARAGEEACLEALEAGADDYLVKPFNARELIARVRSHIQMGRIRRTAAKREGELLQQIAEVKYDLENVLEGTNDAFVSLDSNLAIIALNKTAAQIINAPRQDLIGRPLTEVLPDAGGSTLETALRRTIELQELTTTEKFDKKSNRWFSVRCYPTPHGLILFGNDITERKKAEEALLLAHTELECRVTVRTQELSEANKLLSAVFDRAPGGIAITDMHGKFVRANKAYQELVGYTEADLIGRAMASLVAPEGYSKIQTLVGQLLSHERDSFETELLYQRQDGGEIWTNNFVSTIDDEHRRPHYFVTIAQDITDRKRVEGEILSSQHELRLLYERLQTVREEERVVLAREVHDQLGQILSAAKIDIKLLEDDIRPHDAPLSRRKILVELRSANRTLENAIQLVRQIATELRASELENQGLYAAIEWHVRDFERRTRIQCHLTLPVNAREPTGAPATALFRIFQEAMTNVMRHAKASQVCVHLEPRGDAMLLRVRDDGKGIPSKRKRNTRSFGIIGMFERAAIAKGRLVVGALRSGGTLVAVRIPVKSMLGDGDNLHALARNLREGKRK